MKQGQQCSLIGKDQKFDEENIMFEAETINSDWKQAIKRMMLCFKGRVFSTKLIPTLEAQSRTKTDA